MGVKASGEPSIAYKDASVVLYRALESFICECSNAFDEEEPSVRIREGETIRAMSNKPITFEHPEHGKILAFEGVVLRDEVEMELPFVPLLCCEEIAPKDWTMEDVVNHIVLPATLRSESSYLSRVKSENSNHHSGKQKYVYVSAPRTTKFLHLAQSLLATTSSKSAGRSRTNTGASEFSSTFSERSAGGKSSISLEDLDEDRKGNSDETYFWLDIFSVNQHEDPSTMRHRSVSVSKESLRTSVRRTLASKSRKLDENDSYDEFNSVAYTTKVGIHRSMLHRANGFIVFCDDYTNPSFLKRGWCLWELYGAAKAREEVPDFRIEVLFSPSNESELHDALRNESGFKEVIRETSRAVWNDAEWRLGSEARFAIEEQIMDREKKDPQRHLCKKVSKVIKIGVCTYADRVLAKDNRTRFLMAESIYSLNKSLANMWKKELRTPQKAAAYLKGALDYERANFGAENEKTLATMVMLAAILANEKKYEEAEGLYREIVEVMEKQVGRRQTSTATVLNNLGKTLMGQRKYDEALKLHTEALEIFQEMNGEMDLLVAKTLSNIALVYRKRGEFTMALEFYKKDVKVRKSVEGVNHINLATCYANIAAVYNEQQCYADSLDYYNKALSLQAEHYPKGHPAIKETQSSISQVERLKMYS